MKDLTNLKTYIIDSPDPHEVDDAISIETREANSKRLWIHISNPCSLFLQDSELDIYAKKRNSSLYLVEQYVPMLPENIINKANLGQNKVSNTISASIDFNDDGSIDKYEIVEAIIKPNYQITYEDADEIIELEPKEEKELIDLKDLLLKSISYRKTKGAIIIDMPSTNIRLKEGNVILTNYSKTISQNIISEAMILMGYITSLFLVDNNLSGVFRSQKINCDPNEILHKYKNSYIKYSLLKQYMGRSYITTKPSRHDSLGLKHYVQCTSPLRRYLDLIIQRQVYNKLKNNTQIDKEVISNIIDYSRNKQIEINNIYKNDRFKYLMMYFNNHSNSVHKIIFVKWINHKKNIALVFFPDYLLELLIILYVSIEIYTNNSYKVKYNKSDNNLLEFIY